MTWIAVILGGAAGCAARHAVNLACVRFAGSAVPMATATVNLAGSLAIGALAGLIAIGRLQMSPHARTFGAFTAAALLAGDFLHIVQSRIGMLDAFVTMFVVAAILFAVHDRDRPRPQDWDRRSTGILSGLALHRPWRLLAGMALGAAIAVKWSGAYVALAVIGLTAAWEIAARRSAGTDAPPRSWSRATWLAIREELPRRANDDCTAILVVLDRHQE